MQDPFDPGVYLAYLRSRWRLPAVALALAICASLAFTSLATRRYTARVSLLIEPPASSDPRAAMAVSPIYLESLRTYESFASSDALFAEAARKFDLRGQTSGRRPLEDLKRQVLGVSVPRNTKILEISITLPDARKAHELASYLAGQTVELNRSATSSVDREFVAAAELEEQQAVTRFQAEEAAFEAARKRTPTPQALDADLAQLRERRGQVERLALLNALAASDGDGPGKERAAADAATLREQQRSLEAEVAVKQKLLAERAAEIDRLAAEYNAAREARLQAERRRRDAQSMSGHRSERISLLDPGFVPERPSSPSLPLNLLVAAALALVASMVWLTARFGFEAGRAKPALRLPRVVGKP